MSYLEAQCSFTCTRWNVALRSWWCAHDSDNNAYLVPWAKKGRLAAFHGYLESGGVGVGCVSKYRSRVIIVATTTSSTCTAAGSAPCGVGGYDEQAFIPPCLIRAPLQPSAER